MPLTPPQRALLTVVLAGMLTFPPDARAYIDPGTGSFVIQGIIAAVVGAGVAVKLFWSRIKATLTGRQPDQRDDDGDDV
jgi:hypothetical protein